MSAWPGKYVIGLTGNIATGKSVVRKMLEHLGAYGIDADALAHRAIGKEAPGYKPVVRTFGTWVLAPDGQVDRSRLGNIVFSDPDALAQLEAIVHPMVGKAVDLLIGRAAQEVVVLEAIKLLESGLAEACDSVWVAVASEEIQLARLINKRGMDEKIALQRIRAQPRQEDKIAAAQVVIRNDGSIEETWRLVLAAWMETVPGTRGQEEQPLAVVQKNIIVERARLNQAEEIAAFINRYSKGRYKPSREDIIADFGEKAFLLLRKDGRLIGLAGWQVENLVARTSDVYLQPGIPLEKAITLLLQEVESASRQLQCEVSLLFLPPNLARHENIWQNLRYQARTIQSLKVRAWQEAAEESIPSGTVMLFKQLRRDRVLRPV